MNCGIPYCHNGCPVNNQIPDWNDLVYRGDWQEASRNLHSHQQFPGIHRPRLPRALRGLLHAEHSGHAGHDQDDRMRDRRPRLGARAGSSRSRRRRKTGKRVAVVGSGPAGLACAQQLARVGHEVHVYEKNAKPGGLLRYGIPDFKMEKRHVDRRVEQMKAEGVDLPLQRPCRQRRHAPRRSLDELRRRRARRRRRGAARPAGARPRSRRRSFRDGFPAAAEPPRRPASRSAPTSRSSPAASMSS